MNGTNSTKKEGKKRIKGWLIALIIVVAFFGTGAILCTTLDDTSSTPQVTAEAGK